MGTVLTPALLQTFETVTCSHVLSVTAHPLGLPLDYFPPALEFTAFESWLLNDLSFLSVQGDTWYFYQLSELHSMSLDTQSDNIVHFFPVTDSKIASQVVAEIMSVPLHKVSFSHSNGSSVLILVYKGQCYKR